VLIATALLACTPEVTPEAAVPAPRDHGLAFPLVVSDPEPAYGTPLQLDGYRVTVLALDAAPSFRVGAALYEPDRPNGRAVLMAHGHFAAGKSAPEAQELSHRLARRGVTVIAVDNPGMESWGGPERALHGLRGAVNRAWLAAAGTSALSLQLAALRSALDVLEARGFSSVSATGASGGAVLSFWLALEDERVESVVLAAVPDVPRRPDEGGCSCKVSPGWPGPDPTVVAELSVPSLWLSERPDAELEGLPATARWLHVPGPHSYTPAMQREALAFLGLEVGELVPTPALDLRSSGPGEARFHRELRDLPLVPATTWTPAPSSGEAYEVACEGDGATVLVVGGDSEDVAAVVSGGLRACSVTMDTSGYDADLTRGQVFVDRVAGAMADAATAEGAVAIWAVAGWWVPASAAGVPFVVRDPVATADELAPEQAWVQVPGLWWGVGEERLAHALATADAREPLLAALSSLARGVEHGP